MAFNLDGLINEELITGIMREKFFASLVSQYGVRTHQVAGGASSIKIPAINDILTQDYTGADLTLTPVTDNSVILTLDQNKAFGYTVDSVDDYQSVISAISLATAEGVYRLAEQVDEYTLGVISTGALANSIGSGTVDATNVVDVILEMGQGLDEKNVPTNGRVMFINPQVATALAQANLTLYSDSMATEAGRNGFVGVFGGFTIYKSNKLKDATTGKTILAGVPVGTDMGYGFRSSDIVEAEKSFTYILKGMVNYGGVMSNADSYVSYDAL